MGIPLSRRRFGRLLGGAGLAAALPAPLAFAQGVENRYMVLVVLRGALDRADVVPVAAAA